MVSCIFCMHIFQQHAMVCCQFQTLVSKQCIFIRLTYLCLLTSVATLQLDNTVNTHPLHIKNNSQCCGKTYFYSARNSDVNTNNPSVFVRKSSRYLRTTQRCFPTENVSTKQRSVYHPHNTLNRSTHAEGYVMKFSENNRP